MKAFNNILQVFLTVLCVGRCYCEIYSGADGISTLLVTQSHAVASFEYALRELDKLILNLEHTLSLFKEHNTDAKKDPESFIGNPINSVKLIKALGRDLDQKGTEIHHTFEKLRKIIQKKTKLLYPNKNDLEGTVAAMVRLIDTYKLDHQNISEGRIFDVQSVDMSSNDCYEFAVVLLSDEDYGYASIWLEEAVRKYDAQSNFNLIDAYISLAECEAKKDHGETFESFENITFEALCRDEYIPNPEYYNRLKCYYKFGKNPFLKIAPFKFEEVHPNISLYIVHDVISDDEIEWIKTTAKPQLKRATVTNNDTGKEEPSHYRTAQTAWLSQFKYRRVSKIYQRTRDFIELEMRYAEKFQIGNYGIGGHYSPHYDVLLNSTEPDERLATVMYYLSDVEMGGGTIFLYLGATVFPKKGSAVFWFNLHPSGEGNLVTAHGACPVLMGSKWVANIWIPVKGEEQTYPCNLEYQEQEEITHKLLKKPIRRQEYYMNTT